MGTAIRPLLIFSVFISICLPSSAQSCEKYKFSGNKTYQYCNDLQVLDSFIHYNYNAAEATMEFAYRHKAMAEDTWVAWALNPYLAGMMSGSQCYIAYRRPDGSMNVQTTSIAYDVPTNLMPTELAFRTWNISAIYAKNEIIIFATLQLPENKTTINQVWQDGPVLKGNFLAMHPLNAPHLMAKGTLDLLTGQSVVNQTVPDSARQNKRNVHATLNVLGWGIMMPVGIMIARYLQVVESADAYWLYIHSIWQTIAYLMGVAGFVIGLQMGYTSSTEHPGHKALGITLFCLATLQVLSLFLRPKIDNIYRYYWTIYHKIMGCLIVIVAILNIFKGFNILSLGVEWRNEYFGAVLVLLFITIVLEFHTHNIVEKRKQMIGIVRVAHRQFGDVSSKSYNVPNSYEGRDRHGI